MPHVRLWTAVTVGLLCMCLIASTPQIAMAGSSRSVGVQGAHGLNPRLVSMLTGVAKHFGRLVVVSSGCRSGHGNRRAGGAKHSYHLRCMAADVKVVGISESHVLHFARQMAGRGGVGTYCRNSIVHIDVGPRRDWHERCTSRKMKRTKKRRVLVASRK